MRLPGLLFALLLPVLAWGGERGQPLVQVYNTQELGGGHLNDSLIELPDGRLAVGNVGGLLLFGGRWRMFNHPKMLGGAKHLNCARQTGASPHSTATPAISSTTAAAGGSGPAWRRRFPKTNAHLLPRSTSSMTAPARAFGWCC